MDLHKQLRAMFDKATRMSNKMNTKFFESEGTASEYHDLANANINLWMYATELADEYKSAAIYFRQRAQHKQRLDAKANETRKGQREVCSSNIGA